MQLFEQIYKSGNTVIIVTHEEDIANYARRIIRLRDGKIESDTVNEHRTVFNIEQLKISDMKIYTKGGDKGTTSLVAAKESQKTIRGVEAYGDVDELISFIGLV